jgi:hypothetical protein
MAFWRGDLYLATLGSESLVRIELEAVPRGYRVRSIERWFHDGKDQVGRHSRLRDVVVGPDDALYVLTNKLDAGGDPAEGDRILRIEPCVGIRLVGGARRPAEDLDDDCPSKLSRPVSAATGAVDGAVTHHLAPHPQPWRGKGSGGALFHCS